MAGVVWAIGGGILLGRYANPITLTAGAALPPGEYFLSGAATITTPDGTATSIPGGFVVSDGSNVAITAAGTAIPLGAGLPDTWPWPLPWPLSMQVGASAPAPPP